MEINPLTTIIRDRNNTKKYFIYTFYSEQTKKWETIAVKKVNYESIKKVKMEQSYSHEEALRHHLDFIAHYSVF